VRAHHSIDSSGQHTLDDVYGQGDTLSHKRWKAAGRARGQRKIFVCIVHDDWSVPTAIGADAKEQVGIMEMHDVRGDSPN